MKPLRFQDKDGKILEVSLVEKGPGATSESLVNIFIEDMSECLQFELNAWDCGAVAGFLTSAIEPKR